jgi:hypothetical protein
MANEPDKIDLLFTRAVEILREDRILKAIRGAQGTPDPGNPQPPVPEDPPPAPKKTHWFFGEMDDNE